VKLFIRALQLFVRGDQLFVRRLHFFVARLELLDRCLQRLARVGELGLERLHAFARSFAHHWRGFRELGAIECGTIGARRLERDQHVARAGPRMREWGCDQRAAHLGVDPTGGFAPRPTGRAGRAPSPRRLASLVVAR
jgi:hypothetical protein